MKTRDQLLQRALKTQDHRELYLILEEALSLVSFNEAQLGFSKVREQKLKDQVERQTAMITNLEKTLWKK